MMDSMDRQNNLLRSARIEKRWTPEFVSERVGVSRNTYIRWEAGVQTPRLTSLATLCHVFGLSPVELGFEQHAGAVHSMLQRNSVQIQPSSERAKKRAHAGEMGDVEHVGAVDKVGKRQGSAPLVQHRQNDYQEQKLPAEQSASSLSKQSSAELAELLEYWSAELATYWQLFMCSARRDIEQSVSECLVALSRPSLTPSIHQRESAALSSQGYQLRALIHMHRGDFISARADATQALVYGQLAKDWNVYVAAQIRLALIYSANRRIGAALNAYNDALRRVNADDNHISPILHSWIFAGLAEIQATMGRETEALQLLKLASAVFPTEPEQDPCFLYTRCDRSVLYLYQGLVFLRLGRPRLAWEAFSQVEDLHPAPEERVRVDFLRYRAYTSLVLGNMVQCCVYLEAATRAAQAIESDLAQAEIYVLYQHILAIWGQEPRVRALATLFQR
jgi:transcriptional regulator with XRE-family HTH domain/tetratricopeptide (TPR) repeat protein